MALKGKHKTAKAKNSLTKRDEIAIERSLADLKAGRFETHEGSIAAAKSKRKHDIPLLTEESIKRGIKELEEGKGKKVKNVEELFREIENYKED